MQLRQCALLLPSYELDGYPRSLPSEAADRLLSGWLGMWHPRLIVACQAIPRWHQVENPPSDLQGCLLVLPPIAEELMSSDLESRVSAAGGLLMRPVAPWEEFQQQLMSSLELERRLPEAGARQSLEDGVAGGPAAEQHPEVDSGQASASTPAPAPELLEEFAALGFAFLQVQLMTRQLRYTSNLDVVKFAEQALQAAQAALDADAETARSWLQSCFDALGQERDHYYSLDVHLIDVTLLASSTLGKSLDRQLETQLPSGYLASGNLLSEMQSRYPTTAERLRQACQARQACVLGGLDRERPHPLMTREAMAREIVRGRATYETHLGQVPEVFARLTYGLLPDSASLLKRFGYAGAVLEAFSGGSYPRGNQAKISWEASDGTFLSALAGAVLDADDPASFLSIGWTIGEALDHQNVPTVLFAHWPDRWCNYYRLLRIIASRTPALGTWMLADDYFRDTDQPYHQERLAAKSFQYNWLAETDDAGALIVAVKLYHGLHAQLRSLQNLSSLAWQLEHFRSPATPPTTAVQAPASETPSSTASEAPTSSETPVSESAWVGAKSESSTAAADQEAKPAAQALALSQWAPGLASICDAVDGLLDDPTAAPAAAEQAQQQIDSLVRPLLERLAKQLCRPAKAAASEALPAVLLINPTACPIRVQTHLASHQQLNRDMEWHFADGRVGEDRVACVDIPSLGFVAAGVQGQANTPPKEMPLADAGGLLKNEFLEAQVDMARGHLRSLYVPARRGNRLSFMVTRRTRAEDGKIVHADMHATQLRLLTSSNMCGLVRSSGHLEQSGRKVGDFEIDYQLWRGNRILEVTIRLSQLAALEDDNPWRAAYVARLAWPSEAATVRSHVSGSRYAWAGGKAIAPTLIEIDETDFKTHYLTGGLAFHRRTETRFLETILATDGQTDIEHRIGIAVDLPHPTSAALQFLDAQYELPVQLPVGQHRDSSGWLATTNVNNVTVDLEAPLVDERQQVVGMRLFLTETEGRSTNASIRLFREIESAMRVDYWGGKVGKLTAQADRLTIALRSNEQVNVDVLWK